MREFYVYGFKSRDEYNRKSARTYDDERRRMESWLGEHISYIRTAEGKNVFISIDSRATNPNPLFKAWKAKSFTDGDITLHFIIFDILNSEGAEYSLSELMEMISDLYSLSYTDAISFDESTVRKKLKEYSEMGLVRMRKEGKRTYYSRDEDTTPLPDSDLLGFFSEVAPCGVVGSFLLDKCEGTEPLFDFKHHYITGTLDSDVMATLFEAMHKKCAVSVSNLNLRRDEPRRIHIVPLRIFISVQSGRQHLLAYYPEFRSIMSFRLDYLSSVKLEEAVENFDQLRSTLDSMENKMWGVNTKRNKFGEDHIEHVEFDIQVGEDEEFIISRLDREKRCGRVELVGDGIYRFIADVYDTSELIPWIRTFICRIVRLNFSNKAAEERFKSDLDSMYRIYGVGGDEE